MSHPAMLVMDVPLRRVGVPHEPVGAASKFVAETAPPKPTTHEVPLLMVMVTDG